MDRWLNGSDIPSIMGISPFTTRYEMLQYKAGLKKSEFEGNEYTEYGNVMEPKIRDYINEQRGRDLFQEGKHEDPSTGYRCHTDGEAENEILEIKTTSQVHKNIDDYKMYLVQILFYMMCTKKQYGTLAIYHRPENFDEEFDKTRLQTFDFSINEYEELCDDIMEEVERFKMDLEKLKENPLLSEEDLLPTSVQEISNQIILIEEQLATYKELEKREKELKEKLYEAMMDTGTKGWKTPNGTTITLIKPTEDKTEMVFDENKFKERCPKIYKCYCEEKIKKGRSGCVRITLGKKDE